MYNLCFVLLVCYCDIRFLFLLGGFFYFYFSPSFDFQLVLLATFSDPPFNEMDHNIAHGLCSLHQFKLTPGFSLITFPVWLTFLVDTFRPKRI